MKPSSSSPPPTTPLVDDDHCGSPGPGQQNKVHVPDSPAGSSSDTNTTGGDGGDGDGGTTNWCKIKERKECGGGKEEEEDHPEKGTTAVVLPRNNHVTSSSSLRRRSSIKETATDLLDLYNAALDESPLLTKSITAAIIQGMGAGIASLLKSDTTSTAAPSSSRGGHSARNASLGGTDATGRRHHRFHIDWIEVLAFALHGGLINGPIGHYWFEWLSKNDKRSKFHSMLLDQFVVQPPLLVFMFVFLDMVRAGLRSFRPALVQALSGPAPQAVVSSWKFWPLAVFCTFRYLRKKHYTVALNLCSLAWTVYLSKGQNIS